MKKKHPQLNAEWNQSDVERFWDWVTSLRHRYDGWHQRREALTPSAERLEKRIREAFRKVMVGPYTSAAPLRTITYPNLFRKN